MNDLRGRIRAPFKMSITLITSVKKIEIGNSRDVSLNGIFVETNERLPIGSDCRVVINLTEVTPSIIIAIESKVIRHAADGMGINFTKMEIDDYDHLKNIVLYNTESADDFLDQCYKRPGFK